MLNRNIEQTVMNALADTPAILINGARQTGKSTLVKEIVSKNKAQYLSLDDNNILMAVKNDPIGFLNSYDGNLVLDEIQRAPDLLLAIKKSIDENRKPGKFILTGSANILLLPQIADSLAGRMEIYNLWPFSQGELLQKKEKFIDDLFSSTMSIKPFQEMDKSNYIDKILQGGYPEIVLSRSSALRRAHWYESYLSTIILRDVRDLMQIEGTTQLPPLLQMLAGRSATLLNFADVTREIGIAQTTLKRYFSLFTMTFLIYLLPAWHNDMTKRMTKSPKLLINDSGLLCHLMRVDKNRLIQEPHLLGRILETFVILEILKQSTWSDNFVKLYHWRSHAGVEVDLILENIDGRLVAIEIKSGATLHDNDLKGLRYIAQEYPSRFHRGIILYTGNTVIPFSEKIWAVPISALWG